MNMKLKKLLALLLAMMMAFALVACGDTADTGDDAADDQQQVQDDAAADDTQTSPEGQSLLTILADQFIPAPEVAGTYWTFIGGYVDGVQMTADQTQEVMSQLHDVYQFIFVDESKVVLAEDEEQTEGTYSLSEDGGTMKIEVGGVTYAGTFIDKDGHTVMVAMLDGTGMNALYFQEIIEVRNPYDTPPVMRDGVPVSDAAGHGFGCRSIQAIAQQRGGLCQFLAERGTFLLRVVLPAKGVAE